jgi:threonine dehydrogenase-like Zn-dependent dehydrogenase
MRTMRAAVVLGPDRLEVQDVPAPGPDLKAGFARVRIREVGVCGTDLKILHGSVPVAHPRVLGHEAVGEVIEVGEGGGVTVGDRVLALPEVHCGVCVRCRNDAVHLCGNGGLSGRDMDGFFAEEIVVPSSRLLKLPADLPWEQGPMVQILGTVVHGQRMVQVEPGQVGVVVGLGVSGLLHVQLLRARGVETIVGIGRSPEKLRLAEQLGATVTATPDAAWDTVASLTGGEGADVVIESSGAVAGLATAIEVVRPAGTVQVFGTISTSEGTLPYYQLYLKEVALISSRASRPRDYAAAVDHVASGRVRVGPVLSARFTLEEAPAAVAHFETAPGVLKVTMSVG